MREPVFVEPDHAHLGSSVAVPRVAQLTCPAGVAAVIHPVGAASKYIHAAAQAEPGEVKLEDAT